MPNKIRLEIEIWSESSGGRIVRLKGMRVPEILVPDSSFQHQLQKINAIRAALAAEDREAAAMLLGQLAEETEAWIAMYEAALQKYGDPRPGRETRGDEKQESATP